MLVAWTTLFVAIFIGPGIAFFVGLHTSERHLREPAQTRILVELATATFVAVAVHTAFLTGFELLQFQPISELWVLPLVDRLLNYDGGRIQISVLYNLAGYILGSGAVGWYLGKQLSVLIIEGPLRFMATHKWVYELVKFDGYISAFVMTNTVEDKKVLMYSGYLSEIFLTSDGKIANIVMAECNRYYMNIEDSIPMTGTKTPLFLTRGDTLWNLFVISGENVANALFTLIQPVSLSDADIAKLDQVRSEQEPVSEASPGPAPASG